MKRFLLFIGLFVSSSAFAATQKDTTDSITVAKLAQNGYWVSHGWKFHSGDNPVFASAGYDDSGWQAIIPWTPVARLPVNAQQGIGWLRVKVYVSGQAWQSASLRIFNNTATEIYVDGQLIAKKGTINELTKTGRSFTDLTSSSPVTLPVTDKTEHVIAIRYAWQKGIAFYNVNNYPFS